MQTTTINPIYFFSLTFTNFPKINTFFILNNKRTTIICYNTTIVKINNSVKIFFKLRIKVNLAGARIELAILGHEPIVLPIILTHLINNKIIIYK